MLHVVAAVSAVSAVAVVACQNIARKLSTIRQQKTPTMQIGATAREAHQRATCKCNMPLQGAIDATKARLTVAIGSDVTAALATWRSEAVQAADYNATEVVFEMLQFAVNYNEEALNGCRDGCDWYLAGGEMFSRHFSFEIVDEKMYSLFFATASGLKLGVVVRGNAVGRKSN